MGLWDLELPPELSQAIAALEAHSAQRPSAQDDSSPGDAPDTEALGATQVAPAIEGAGAAGVTGAAGAIGPWEAPGSEPPEPADAQSTGGSRYWIGRLGLVMVGLTPFLLFVLLLPRGESAGQSDVVAVPSTIPSGAGLPLVFPSDSPLPSPSSPAPDPSPSASPRMTQCNNGKDDDRDGKIDFPADKGCSSRNDNSESPDPSPAPTPSPPPSVSPSPSPEPAPPVTQCNDGIDNDGDSAVDMQDPDCSSPSDDSEAPEPVFSPDPSPTKSPSGPPGTTECNDGIDNDGDGLTDWSPTGTGDPNCRNIFDNSE
jgi:hypothetical protein